MERNPTIRDALSSLSHVIPLLHRLAEDRSVRSEINRASIAQMKIVHYIFTGSADGGGVYAKDIARAVCVTPGSVSQTVALLEKNGMIERTRDKDDGRASRIVLSEKGREIFRRRNAVFASLADRLFSDIPASEQAVFASVLARMHERLAAEVAKLSNDSQV